ncbi:protein associated with UVRAG as autophagy enhancer isoform X2 [Heptranchias perlo]|uniref:protein associated with UVRAG as autophagy enhancer isoform X2 n=1 Tax=Heptranchias perlo TaxID=212740 RepID=UPI00355A3404
MKLARESDRSSVAKAKNASTSGLYLNTSSPLSQSLCTSVLSDEYSRPAVMGQTAVSSGQHSNSPEAIKEILISVLETFDDFKPPPTEKCTANARLSSLTVFQNGDPKKIWGSQSGDNEQQQGVGIPMTSKDDSCSSSSSLTVSPEQSSSHIISNTFSKLILSVQSTAARCMSFTDGVPPMVSMSDQSRYQRSQSDSLIHSEKEQYCLNNRPETILYTSYLSNPSFSASRAQERENTHLVVADMVIAALENVKCNIMYERAELVEDGSLTVIQTPADDLNSCIKKEVHSDSVDSGYECGSATQLDDSFDAGSKSLCEDQQNEFDDIFGSDGPLKSIERHCLSAEYLARRLFKSFRTTWLPSETEVNHLDTVEMVLDKFLPLKDTPPGAEESVDLTADFKLNYRLRGTADWAPPRFQILFFIHAPQRREVVVAAQNSMCAGCGTPIEPKYIKKLRYCEYLGKYFCECCHHNEESPIPGRILMKWDFSKHPVCHFSKQLLESIWHDPLFNIFYINKSLYSKVKELRKANEIQEQLIHIKKLLRTCRLAKSAMIEFWQIHSHLTEELHLYSLNDLMMVKRGLLVPGLKGTLRNVLAHVESCELCLAKGFICEFCRNKDILFPFQTDQCKRCHVCKACFHKECFKAEQCPKCARIHARKELLLAFQQPTG